MPSTSHPRAARGTAVEEAAAVPTAFDVAYWFSIAAIARAILGAAGIL